MSDYFSKASVKLFRLSAQPLFKIIQLKITDIGSFFKGVSLCNATRCQRVEMPGLDSRLSTYWPTWGADAKMLSNGASLAEDLGVLPTHKASLLEMITWSTRFVTWAQSDCRHKYKLEMKVLLYNIIFLNQKYLIGSSVVKWWVFYVNTNHSLKVQDRWWPKL